MDPVTLTIESLQKRFERFSPTPRIAKCLRSLVATGNVNPDDIVALIRLEPLLATRILREANLTQGNRTPRYLSIEEAVTAIGFQRMYTLLGLYSCPSDDRRFSYSANYWKRAVTTAVCMDNLARKHQIDPQQAYAIGLIHSLAEGLASPESEQTTPSAELSNRLQRFDYSSYSYSLLRDWGLPDGLVDPIRFQLSPLDCQTTGKMACLLHLSKWITGVVREVDELPNQASGPDLLVLNLLGEGEQTLWNLVTDVSDSLVKADTVVQGKQNSSLG